jgi:hypothetical protein
VRGLFEKDFDFKDNSFEDNSFKDIQKLSSFKDLTHFLPSKLRTTYSYAQVKFEKNEWCHQKKNHKKIIYTPILYLFGGNIVWCLLVSLTITCLPDF